jgi:hypothetical protein
MVANEPVKVSAFINALFGNIAQATNLKLEHLFLLPALISGAE